MSKKNDLDAISITEMKQNLSKMIKKANETGEPVFILSQDKTEAVLLSNESYEKLINEFNRLEEQVLEYEVSKRIEKHDAQEKPKTYTSEDLGIDLTDVEWFENDGWE